MSHIFKLYIMLQKNNRSDDGNGNSGIDSNKMIMYIIGGIAAIILGFISNKFADTLSTLGGTSFIVPVIGALVTAGTMGLGFASLLNQMYMSSDIEVLITMPFSSIQIVILRVLSLFQNVLLASVAFIIIPCIGYSAAHSLGAGEWCGIIAVVILLPIFATSILATVIILLMSFLKFFQSRETLRIIGAVVLFFVMCAYMYLSSGNSQIEVQDVLTQLSKIVGIIKYVVPVLGLAVAFMEKGSLLYLLYALLCTIAAAVIFIIVAKALYLQGAMNMQDASRGKKLSSSDIDKYCTKKPVIDSLILKEFRMVRRNPVYMLHNFIIGALWPVLAVLVFKQVFTSISSDMDSNLMDVFLGPISLDGFLAGTTMITLGGIAIASLPLTMQTIAVSSLSREGKSFMIMKQIPVAYDLQLEAKRRMARNVAHVSVTAYFFLIIVAASIIVGFPVIYCFLPTLLIALYTELHVNIAFLSGIKNTNVNWDDERSTTKKSAPLIIFGFGSLMIFMILCTAMTHALSKALLPYSAGIIPVIVVGILFAIINVIVMKKIKKAGVLKIRRLRF